MRTKGRRSPYRLKRGLVAITVSGVTGMMLIAFALAFSNAASAREIAESSQELQWANAAAGTAALSRAAVNQALVFAVDHQLDVASEEAASQARAEAHASFDALAGYLESPPGTSRREVGDVAQLLELGRTALTQLERGDIRDADATLTREFEPAYGRAAESLHNQQLIQAGRIDAAASGAGRSENITRLIVTVLIPAAAIIIHQLIIRRQYRERQVHMEAQIDAERVLNRSKDEFIAGISHELRTPLTSIYGFSEHILENGLIDPTEALELIAMINDDSAELSRMVDDLLAAARIDADALAYETEPLELMGEVEHLVDQFRRAGSEINVLGGRTVGLADRSRLRQVLRNLISNAERHGGNLIEVDVAVTAGQAAIRVLDDGPGVDPAMEERLFSRFVHDGRSTLTSGSVGLGLAIARQMARDMGGDITYERALGMTLFSVLLPLAPAHALPVPRVPVPEAQIYNAGHPDGATASVPEINPAGLLEWVQPEPVPEEPAAAGKVVMFE